MLLIFLIFPIVGLIAALVLGSQRVTTSDLPLPPPVVYTPNTLVDKPAPDFTLITPDGQPLQLSSLRGRVVFLNFWATWCAPCRQEMPAFQQVINGTIPGRATVLAVDKQENADAVHQFYKELSLSVPAVLDADGSISDMYRLVALPHTFVIDTDGIIRYDHIGIMTTDDLVAYIKQLSPTYF